jgi:hypothetical protein
LGTGLGTGLLTDPNGPSDDFGTGLVAAGRGAGIPIVVAFRVGRPTAGGLGSGPTCDASSTALRKPSSEIGSLTDAWRRVGTGGAWNTDGFFLFDRAPPIPIKIAHQCKTGP